nr:hypothetical protein [Croceicoccus hydrothermalis]
MGDIVGVERLARFLEFEDREALAALLDQYVETAAPLGRRGAIDLYLVVAELKGIGELVLDRGDVEPRHRGLKSGIGTGFEIGFGLADGDLRNGHVLGLHCRWRRLHYLNRPSLPGAGLFPDPPGQENAECLLRESAAVKHAALKGQDCPKASRLVCFSSL